MQLNYRLLKFVIYFEFCKFKKIVTKSYRILYLAFVPFNLFSNEIFHWSYLQRIRDIFVAEIPFFFSSVCWSEFNIAAGYFAAQ